MGIHQAKCYWIGNINVSPEHNELALGERRVALQPKVMEVLQYLALHADRVISNDELLEQVWSGRVVTHSSIQKSINALRSAFAELDPDTEYVAHYSKRGYQLVCKVSANKAVKGDTFRLFRVAGLVGSIALLLSIGLLVRWYLPEDTIDAENSRPLERQTTTLPYTNVSPFMPGDRGRLSIAEPYGVSGRVAYVSEGQKPTSSSQLTIHNNSEHWDVSVARGHFADLAWSPSGRNLVAVDVHSDEGPVQSPDYYTQPQNYHTFHIFTLDFKGEKVVEKNVLSHWLGHVSSVTWWDENTLEFVASQGVSGTFERYRYFIPEQALTRLELPARVTPIISRVRGSYTAVLLQKKRGTFISFYEGGKTLGSSKLVNGAMDITWLPGGEGVLVLLPSNKVAVVLRDGQQQELKLPEVLGGDIQRLRVTEGGQVLIASKVLSVAQLEWLNADDSRSLTSEFDAEIIDARFNSHEGTVDSLIKKGDKLFMQRFLLASAELLVQQPLPLKAESAVWSSPGKAEILFYEDGAVWKGNFGSSERSVIIADAPSVKPLMFAPDTKRFWGLLSDEGMRNIWQFNPEFNKGRQYTFGNIGAAFVAGTEILFQYTSKTGLWLLDTVKGEISQISKNMPANVRILSVEENFIYYVAGGKCRESAIHQFDLVVDESNSVWVQKRKRMHTFDFHPQNGALQQPCGLNESGVIKLTR